MSTGFFKVQAAKNEPILNYAVGSTERTALQTELTKMKATSLDIPMVINGKEVRTNNKFPLNPPHNHQHVLGYFHEGDQTHVQHSIDTALAAREQWANMPWEHRLTIFLKAAELSAKKYRWELNAATMLGQSKNAYQAEIDAACELIDFLRFNVAFYQEIMMIVKFNSVREITCVCIKNKMY